MQIPRPAGADDRVIDDLLKDVTTCLSFLQKQQPGLGRRCSPNSFTLRILSIYP